MPDPESKYLFMLGQAPSPSDPDNTTAAVMARISYGALLSSAWGEVEWYGAGGVWGPAPTTPKALEPLWEPSISETTITFNPTLGVYFTLVIPFKEEVGPCCALF